MRTSTRRHHHWLVVLCLTLSPLLAVAPAQAGVAGFRGEDDPDTAYYPRRSPRFRRDVFRFVSPDTAQTYTNGHTVRNVLLWDRRRGELVAQLTFSNYIEVERYPNVRREEFFNFRLPGVTLDPAAGVFYARDGRGRTVPVAAYQRGGLASGNIRPTPGTTIFVAKPEGRVHVSVTATPGSPALATAASQGEWVIDGVVSVL